MPSLASVPRRERPTEPVTLLAYPHTPIIMKQSLMDIICCPLDKQELELDATDTDDEEVLAGTLTCTECGETFPIEDGIPNLLPPDMRDVEA